MVFSSTLFLFWFLPLALGGYYLIKNRFCNYWLLFMSLIFFAWSQPQYIYIILASIFLNYISAIGISYFQKKIIKKIILIIAIAINLIFLFWFKYLDFSISTINNLFHTTFALRKIVLPVGISFFTFQGMSYVIDIYRGAENSVAQKNPLNVSLYIMLFPQLIAGPIVRYNTIAKEITSRTHSLEMFTDGVRRFILGLAKKSIIANAMASVVDTIWAYGPDNNTIAIAWLGSIAYSLQIYFDFSGYSDMAIGLGRMFGFHFMENFNIPYMANSIKDFWRRWHISLSTWFRDYVYIPLGGNRKHTYLNLCIVFLLTGIWHGAAWTFVLWGIWHGFFLIIERLFHIDSFQKTKWLNPLLKDVLMRLYTLLVINIGWVLFRSKELSLAVQYIGTMFGIGLGKTPVVKVLWYLDRYTILILIAGFFFSTPFPNKIIEFVKGKTTAIQFVMIQYIYIFFLLVWSLLRIVSGTYNPFIYFQF